MVEWIFAFETRRIVSRSTIDNVVDGIVKMLEYAKGFPPRTPDVGGSTVAKSRHHMMKVVRAIAFMSSTVTPCAVG